MVLAEECIGIVPSSLTFVRRIQQPFQFAAAAASLHSWVAVVVDVVTVVLHQFGVGVVAEAWIHIEASVGEWLQTEVVVAVAAVEAFFHIAAAVGAERLHLLEVAAAVAEEPLRTEVVVASAVSLQIAVAAAGVVVASAGSLHIAAGKEQEGLVMPIRSWSILPVCWQEEAGHAVGVVEGYHNLPIAAVVDAVGCHPHIRWMRVVDFDASLQNVVQKTLQPSWWVPVGAAEAEAKHSSLAL